MKKFLVLGLCCSVTAIAIAGVNNAFFNKSDTKVAAQTVAPASIKAPVAQPTQPANHGVWSPNASLAKGADKAGDGASALTRNVAPALSPTQLVIQGMKERGEVISPELYTLAQAEVGSTPTRPVGDFRQGGETVATATVIASMPYSDTGTTAGHVNDYDAVCDYTGSTSPDVVYSYQPTASEVLTIDLCNSSYDTKVYVFQNTAGNVIACNDDYYFAAPCFVYSSLIEAVTVTPGNTYYIVVDGYGTASGNYVLDITGGSCDPINCVGTAEVEPNNGPNEEPVVFGEIELGETVCGTVFTYTTPDGDSRDMDWFEILLMDDNILQITLNVESFNGILFFLDEEDNVITSVDAAGYCQDEVLTTDCLQMGTYHIVAAPNVFTGIPDPVNYGLTVTGTECTYTSPCNGAVELACDGSYDGNTTGGVNYVGNPAPDDFYVFECTEEGTEVTFSLCDGATWDTYLRLYDRCPTDAGAIELGFNDDGCGTLQSILTSLLSVGEYYLVVEGYSSNSGAYTLSVSCEVVGPIEYGNCQTVHGPDEGWTFSTSEASAAGTAYECRDRFGDGGEIWSLEFVGGALYNTPSWAECNENPMPFIINFYDVDQDLVESYQTTLAGEGTGDEYAGIFESLLFTFDLPEPLVLNEGWIGIQGAGSNTCWFLWGSSSGADDSALQFANGVPTTVAYDLNFCLTVNHIAGPCDDAVELACDGSYDGDTTDGTNYVGNAAPDDFYMIDVDEDGTEATFSLCDAADWDTFLRLYDRCPTDAGAVQIGSNDDGCGTLQSELVSLLDAGTYYLIVEGFGSESGPYTLSVTCEVVGPSIYTACQPVHGPDEGWTFSTSEASAAGTAYECRDRFGAAGEIWALDFVGGALYNSPSWAECNENPMPFTINFYDVGQNLVQSYQATLQGVGTGDEYAGIFESMTYSFELPQPLTLVEGWIGIQGGGSNTCWFMWGSAAGADNSAVQLANGVPTTVAYDLNYCLTFTGAVDSNEQPAVFALGNAYPNPFNPSTTIDFTVPTASPVKLSVRNINGQEVAVLVNGDMAAGSHSITFDASGLASGVYTYTLSNGQLTETKSFTLVK